MINDLSYVAISISKINKTNQGITFLFPFVGSHANYPLSEQIFTVNHTCLSFRKFITKEMEFNQGRNFQEGLTQLLYS